MSVLGATVLVAVLLAAAVFGLVVMRRRLRGSAGAADVAAAQRRYLASNWLDVEAAAVRGGMDAEQIAEVRRELLGG